MFSTSDSRHLYPWQYSRTARHDEPVSASGVRQRFVNRPHRDHPHSSHLIGRKL
jgi:hypothetical protein